MKLCRRGRVSVPFRRHSGSEIGGYSIRSDPGFTAGLLLLAGETPNTLSLRPAKVPLQLGQRGRVRGISAGRHRAKPESENPPTAPDRTTAPITSDR
jgi:hypothetical protein